MLVETNIEVLVTQHQAGVWRYLRLIGCDDADRVWAEVAAEDDGVAYREALKECLDTLAPRSRRAIELRYEEKRSRADMAEMLGLAPNGVKTLLHRVRATLRECVEKRIGS